MVTPGELRTTALRYADLGYRVFPCIPGTKHPITRHGFHDASTDRAQIEAWWTKFPTANIGLATEGMLVVDIDGANNPWPGDADQMADLASAGAMAQTPRGGRHYLFRRVAGKHWKCSTGKLAQGVDIRTDGGYIVAAPSEIREGPYRWAETLELEDRLEQLTEPPTWLIEALDALADDELVDRMAEQAYADIVASGRWSYRRFVADIETRVIDPVPRTAGPRTTLEPILITLLQFRAAFLWWLAHFQTSERHRKLSRLRHTVRSAASRVAHRMLPRAQ